jgi:AcrR family transcriptional regulator
MDATIAELSEVGYAALRIETVAERAGVNKTTIYRRWGDKAGLVATAFLERHRDVVPQPDTGSLHDDLLGLLTDMRQGLQTPWVAVLLREVGPRSPHTDGVHEVLDKIWPARSRSSRVIFERAIARGELPTDTDPDFLIEALSGPLYFRWLILGHPLSDEFLQRTAEFVLAGAKARPHRLITEEDTVI